MDTTPIEHRHGIRERAVALTFDDGPSAWTAPILDLLAEHEAAGTFFVLGSAIEGREEVLRRIVAAGSEIGNHTYSHPRLPTLPDDEIRGEIGRTTALVEDVTREKVRYWRAPHFRSDPRVRTAIAPLGLREVRYSLVPADWTWPARKTARNVLGNLRPGDVVVLHDGRPPSDGPRDSAATREETAKAVSKILARLRADGYRCVTVSELVTLT